MALDLSEVAEIRNDTKHPHHQKMTKMHRQDTLVLKGWIVVLWIILSFVYLTVVRIVPDYSKIIALVIGIILGVFSTAAILACNDHLTRNKVHLYLTDIMHQVKFKVFGQNFDFMKIFDIFFILLLCYLSLLLPILLRGTVLVGSGEASGMDYTLNPVLLGLVVLSGVGYMVFLVQNSDKELRQVINTVYGKKEENQ